MISFNSRTPLSLNTRDLCRATHSGTILAIFLAVANLGSAVAEAPSGITLSNNTIGRNVPLGRLVGSFTVQDPDVGDTHTLTLVAGEGSTHNATFTIDGVDLRTDAVISVAADTELTIRVAAEDSEGEILEMQFTIVVQETVTSACLEFDNINAQLDAFLQDFAITTNDIASDGVPDEATFALAEFVACRNNGAEDWGATLNAFDINVAILDTEADALALSAYHELIPMLMSISTATQDAVRTILGSQALFLTGDYTVVLCDSAGACTPAQIPGLTLSEGFEVFDPSAKSVDEVFAGDGNLDRDAALNVTEWNNVVAAGFGVAQYVQAAANASIDGTEFEFQTSGGGGGCFIATAAYGTPLSQDIHVLREFRDNHLLDSVVGTAFVDTYYRCSPPVADWIARHPLAAQIVRMAIFPLIALIDVLTGMSAVGNVTLLAFVLSLGAFPVFRLRGRTAR